MLGRLQQEFDLFLDPLVISSRDGDDDDVALPTAAIKERSEVFSQCAADLMARYVSQWNPSEHTSVSTPDQPLPPLAPVESSAQDYARLLRLGQLLGLRHQDVQHAIVREASTQGRFQLCRGWASTLHMLSENGPR